MANLKPYLLFHSFLLISTFAWADVVIEHTPPSFELGKQLILTVKSDGAEKVVALVSEPAGIKIKNLKNEADVFIAPIEFGSLAQIKYQFLITYSGGNVVETPYYVIRQPGDELLEEKIDTLSEELASVRLQTQNLGNSMSSLQNSDSKSMKQRRSEELGNAVLGLKKAEKEYEQSTAAADKIISDWITTLKGSESGKYIHAARVEIENDNMHYFNQGNK